MKHENKRWQQIWGGVFIALSLLIYAFPFIGPVAKQPVARQFQELLNQISINSGLVRAIPANRLTTSPAMKVVDFLSNPPALCLLFVGVAWVWNARKKVGIWSYRVIAVYLVLLSAGLLVDVYITRGRQMVKSPYPIVEAVAALIFLGTAAFFFWRATMLAKLCKEAEPGTGSAPAQPRVVEEAPVPAGPARPRRPATVASCNVLQTSSASPHLWQFDARGGAFKLCDEVAVRDGEVLASSVVGKSWSSLLQTRLNVAWLPPENVFLRVAQFPQSNFEETRAMVELQLEKLSPIPVTQALWTIHLLPHSAGNMQTVIVIIVERSVVEEFLGQLEKRGFVADMLETSMLDQLLAVPISGDGAWIYPEARGKANTALVAWWYGGVLQNIDFITLPAGNDRAASMRDQLTQMAWGGELEGWLTSPPRWHLVADKAMSAEWELPLHESMEQPVEVVTPVSRPELAALTAKRAAQTQLSANLLPAEFAARYKEQFVDRLWLRGLGAVIALYLVVVLVYFVALGFFSYQTNAVEQQVKEITPAYTKVTELQARYKVLKERQELKYAALDCWQAVAEMMPEGLTLVSMNFGNGNRLMLAGTAPADQTGAIIDFIGKLHKAPAHGQPGELLFNPDKNDSLNEHINPGTATVNWTFELELKQGEAE
jgi:hypothetical protein